MTAAAVAPQVERAEQVERVQTGAAVMPGQVAAAQMAAVRVRPEAGALLGLAARVRIAGVLVVLGVR